MLLYLCAGAATTSTSVVFTCLLAIALPSAVTSPITLPLCLLLLAAGGCGAVTLTSCLILLLTAWVPPLLLRPTLTWARTDAGGRRCQRWLMCGVRATQAVAALLMWCPTTPHVSTASMCAPPSHPMSPLALWAAMQGVTTALSRFPLSLCTLGPWALRGPGCALPSSLTRPWCRISRLG